MRIVAKQNKKLVILSVLFLSLLASEQDTQASTKPHEAAVSLPGGKYELTLERSVIGAMRTESFQLLQAGRLIVDKSQKLANAVFDPSLEASANVVSDSSQAISPFAANRTVSQEYKTGASKFFRSGTKLTAEVGQRSGDITFTNVSDISFRESYASISLSQNLWKDFFGRQSRWRLQAGELASQAAKLEIEENAQDWLVDIITVYYNAWFYQEQVRAARENLDRKRKLLEITRLKVRRGTAESPDLYQAKKSFNQAERNHIDAYQQLKEVWRWLVVSLSLDLEWLKLDPMKVHLELDQPVMGAQASCGSLGSFKMPPSSKEIERLQKLKESQLRLRKSYADALRPDLKLQANFTSNGVDATRESEALNDAFSGENPAVSVGVVLTVPLGRSQEKAEFQQALYDAKKAELDHSAAVDDQTIDWNNNCAKLYNWQKKRVQLVKSEKEQVLRNRLEEKRYRLGRSSLLSIIQAGDEATDEKLSLRQAEIQEMLAAWQIHRMTGQTSKYLKGLQAKVAAKVSKP